MRAKIDRRTLTGVAAGLAVIVFLAAGQLISREGFPIGALVVAPVITAVLASEWPTIAVGVIAFVTSAMLPSRLHSTTAHIVRLVLVAVGAAVAAWLAHVRVRREAELADRVAQDRYAEQLNATVARLDTLLDRSPASFAFFSADGVVSRTNESFAALFGYTAGELTGQSLAAALPKIWPRVQPLVERVSTTGKPIVDLEVSGRAAWLPGVEHHWLLSLFPVQRTTDDGKAESLGLGALVVDITERKRAEQEIELLAHASNLFAVDLSFDDALEHVSRLAIPTFADACIVFLPTPDRLGKIARVTHRDPHVEQHLRELVPRLPPRQPDRATERAMRTGEIELIEVVTAEERRAVGIDAVDVEFFEMLGAVSAITVPLGLGGRSIGAIVLLFTTASDRRYRDVDVELARELGRRIAQVLENVRLAGDAARAAARLSLLARVGELLTVELDLEQRLRNVARLVLPELADACGAYLIRDGKLQLVAAGHPDPRLQFALDQSAMPSHPLDEAVPPCEAVRTGTAVLVKDVPDAIAHDLVAGVNPALNGERRRGITSYLAVPLVGEEGPIGALGFAFTFSRRSYDEDDIAIALELARRVAPAVENARRYEGTREVIEVLQRSLLPAALPSVPGVAITGRYLPGAAGLRIGGDWYDALMLADGRIFFAIGDVVGHGVRAAASMGRLRNALEVFAVDEASPARILTRLNRHFSSFADADMATVGLLIYDPATHVARIASAGHPAPVIRDADGKVTYVDTERGMPICASPRATYKTTDVEIPPGATVLLYTDGLVERRGEPLDVGFDRLVEAVGAAPADPDALADHVIDTLLSGVESNDDVALLVVHYEAVQPDFSVRVGTNPRELARVRRAIADWARDAQATPEECDDIVLAVNEAVANSMLHAYGLSEAQVEVVASRTGAGTLEVRVRDFGNWRPDRPRAGGGRGLALISDLMDDVTVDTNQNGTTVHMRRTLAHRAGEPA